MIIDWDTGKIRLTRAEFSRVQRANARHGFAMNEDDIRTFDDYHEAVIMGLPVDIVHKMLEFFETGNYPGMEENLARRAQAQRDGGRDKFSGHGAQVPDILATARSRRNPGKPGRSAPDRRLVTPDATPNPKEPA